MSEYTDTEIMRLNADLSALMDAFNDQAGQLQQAQAREDGWRKSYEDKRDAFNDQAAENERLTKQRDFAQEGWAKAEATIERLTKAIKDARPFLIAADNPYRWEPVIIDLEALALHDGSPE